MDKNQKLIATAAAVVIAIGALGAYSQKEVLAAKAFFPASKFTTTHVEKIGDLVWVSQEVEPARQLMNAEQYKDCPYEDAPVWMFQSQSKMMVRYEISGTVVAEVECPSDWTLAKSTSALLGNY